MHDTFVKKEKRKYVKKNESEKESSKDKRGSKKDINLKIVRKPNNDKLMEPNTVY